MKSFVRRILFYFNLEKEIENFDTIHEVIQKDVVFKGTNLWILVLAILVASVGLNVNSNPVIIGAMLISPLMGPINGMGYSIATYNFPLFRRAVKNFSFAVGAGLIASTLYFLISPVSTAHSELLARTSPTIYDVLIAGFGGLAGILAISSKQKGNVIPGVAIATALMPPLCTAGFGLATGQFQYFFGALYLFTINTVFIAFSALLVSQLLKFPIRTIIDKSKKQRVNQMISVVIAATVIPSIYFGYGLVQKEKFTNNATRYTNSIDVFEGNYLLKKEIDPDNRSITLVYGGSTLTSEQKEKIKDRLADFLLKNVELKFKQGFSINELNGTDSEVTKLKTEINKLTKSLNQKELEKDSFNLRLQLGKQILKEIKPLFPQITACSFSEALVFNDTIQVPTKREIVFIKASQEVQLEERQKIRNWLVAKLESDKIKVIYEFY
jgi:uncharacterized hydrophobic protein (TIGR00271 family)